MPPVSGANQRIDADALFVPLTRFGLLGLAVSGGPDSLALMLLAHRFAAEGGRHGRFIVYSVDHGLRPEAAAETAFVIGEAARLGFRARALRWEGDKPATGIQAAARQARYRLLCAAMREDGAEALLTAHHLGDQAETVLMRLAHGSGIEGLRGMDGEARVEGVTVIRPLLGIDPRALRAVVDAAGIAPVTDPSNSDLDYERVRWRLMLPQLAALGLDAPRLARFAARMRDADEAIAAAARGAFGSVAQHQAGHRIVIERAAFAALPRAVAVRVLQQALSEVGGGRKPHALAPVEALAERLAQGPVRTTLHGCLVSAGARNIRIGREPGRAAAAARRRGGQPPP